MRCRGNPCAVDLYILHLVDTGIRGRLAVECNARLTMMRDMMLVQMLMPPLMWMKIEMVVCRTPWVRFLIIDGDHIASGVMTP